MPIYRYRCELCEHDFELEQSMDHEPEAECPVCGKGVAVVRIPFPQAIIMKEGGG